MTLARDFTDPNKVVEFTQAVNLIPNQYGLLNEKGLFSSEYISQNTLQFESIGASISVIPDAFRGTRRQVNKQPGGKMLTYSSTFHPLDDALFASELQGVRRFGTADQPDVESERIAKKLESIRRSHAATLETARWVTLTTGAQYAPNATQAANFYTDFGISRVTKDLLLGTATTEVMQIIQEAVASIQDTILSGEVVNGFTVYCSPGFFAKLTKHAKVTAAFTYYSSIQEPLRQGFRSGKFQRFEYGGVTFIEVRGGYNGQLFIPVNEAYMVAEGTTDIFKTYFTPAARFDTVNTIAEEVYVWMFKNQGNTEITVQSESSFVNVLTKPQAVVQLMSSN